MIFPISRSKYKILRHIYENPGCGIAEVLKATKTSVKSGYAYIDEMLKSDIVAEKLRGRKPTLRLLRPNFSESGAAAFTLVELEKRLDFYNRHGYLSGPLLQFGRETGNIIDAALVFGSFARGAETKESDLDILAICNRAAKGKIESIQERCFVTLRNRVSLRLMERKDFIALLRSGDEFAVQIAKEHIAIVNAMEWVKIASESQ